MSRSSSLLRGLSTLFDLSFLFLPVSGRSATVVSVFSVSFNCCACIYAGIASVDSDAARALVGEDGVSNSETVLSVVGKANKFCISGFCICHVSG